MNNNIPEPNTNQGPAMQPQNNLNITQSINPQQEALNNLNSEQPINQPPLPPMPPKKSKGPLVIIILLILIILGLAGYICYDKFIAKDNKCEETKSNESTTKKVSVNEYTSIDGKEYLKLNDDNTYELKYADTTQDQKYITNNGKYTKESDGYKLDGKYIVIKETDLIEIEGIIPGDENYKENKVLFDKTKIDSIKKSIDENVYNNVKKIGEQSASALPLEKIETNNINCFRYSFNGEKMNRSNITCGIGYKIYLKDYNEAECKKEESSNVTNTKYIPYMIPAGECATDHISYGIFYSLDQNNNYKTLSTFSGL